MSVIHQQLILNRTLINIATEVTKTYIKGLAIKLDIFSSVEDFGTFNVQDIFDGGETYLSFHD